MNATLLLLSVVLLVPSSCGSQASPSPCPTPTGGTRNDSNAVTRRIEIMYRSGTSDAAKQKIRSALCMTSVRNLGDPNQEQLIVRVLGDEALKKALDSIQKNPVVITARLSSVSHIE